MAFGHEKLDVYRAAIEYVGWAYRFCEALATEENEKAKALPDRIVAMLTELGHRLSQARFPPPGRPSMGFLFIRSRLLPSLPPAGRWPARP